MDIAKDTMAEWLRRQIRIWFDHLFPSGSAGSNPAGVVLQKMRKCVYTVQLNMNVNHHSTAMPHARNMKHDQISTVIYILKQTLRFSRHDSESVSKRPCSVAKDGEATAETSGLRRRRWNLSAELLVRPSISTYVYYLRRIATHWNL